MLYLRFSNINPIPLENLIELQLSQIDVKLNHFKDTFYNLIPYNEALLRAIKGDKVSLLKLVSLKQRQSPLAHYEQLNLDDSKLLTYYRNQINFRAGAAGNTLTIPILVIACNRKGVERTMLQIIKQKYQISQRSSVKWPLVVSQGCRDSATQTLINKYARDIAQYKLNIPQVHFNVNQVNVQFRGYYKIAAHFKLALDTAFDGFPEADAVIVVEDDLDIAPDFLEYFAATYGVLKEDATLLCVSAFNDNGRPGLINMSDPAKLHRTDFFPGLGWMLLRTTWLELRQTWPAAFWDDHLRSAAVRRSRSCIRPEISRSYTFGQIGVSNGLFFQKYLQTIVLNSQPIAFAKLNVSSMLRRDQYDATQSRELRAATPVSLEELLALPEATTTQLRSAVLLRYSGDSEYYHLADKFGLMSDLRNGVPRTGYNGVVSFFWKSNHVFLVPAFRFL